MGITLAIFRLFGYIPVFMDKLKIFSNAGANNGDESLINLMVYSSYPVELLFFKSEMTSIISDSVMLWKKHKMLNW